MSVIDYVFGEYRDKITKDFKLVHPTKEGTPDQLKAHIMNRLSQMYHLAHSATTRPGVVCGNPDEEPKGILGVLGYHCIGFQVLTPKGKKLMDMYCGERGLPIIPSTNADAHNQFVDNMMKVPQSEIDMEY